MVSVSATQIIKERRITALGASSRAAKLGLNNLAVYPSTWRHRTPPALRTMLPAISHQVLIQANATDVPNPACPDQLARCLSF